MTIPYEMIAQMLLPQIAAGKMGGMGRSPNVPNLGMPDPSMLPSGEPTDPGIVPPSERSNMQPAPQQEGEMTPMQRFLQVLQKMGPMQQQQQQPLLPMSVGHMPVQQRPQYLDPASVIRSGESLWR